MLSEEHSHDVVPANSMCANVKHDTLTISQPGTKTTDTLTNIDKIQNQMEASAVHDNVDAITVKPLYGGKNKKNNNNGNDNNKLNFNINFRNKDYVIKNNNEIDAINEFLNVNLKNKIYKKDNLLEITHKNRSSLYVVRGHKKNTFVKIP